MRRPLAAAAALLVLVVAGCSGDPSSDPGPTPTPSGPAAPPPTDLPADADLTVVSFNVLGAAHTAAGGSDEELGSGVERGRAALDLLRGYDPDLIALQELQESQAAFVQQRLGRRYGMLRDLDNSVLWRRDLFTLLDRTTITIPYFRGEPRRMPVVRLRLTGTRQVITVLGLHNPADVHGDATAYRAEAVAIERAFVERERARGRAVVLMGDLNDHEITYCSLARGNVIASANGGAYVQGECVPPEHLQIDWILGSGVEFTGFVSDGSTQDAGLSDHPMLAATLDLTGR